MDECDGGAEAGDVGVDSGHDAGGWRGGRDSSYHPIAWTALMLAVAGAVGLTAWAIYCLVTGGKW